MSTINPYLNFPGTAEEAFNFYKSVFGGEFVGVYRFKDMSMEGQNLHKEDENKIMHIALPIGENLLMASDALESMGQKVQEGNNTYVSVSVKSKEEADKIYNGLSPGGQIEMEIGDVPWGSYFGMFKDKYGVQWMVSYDYPQEEK